MADEKKDAPKASKSSLKSIELPKQPQRQEQPELSNGPEVGALMLHPSGYPVLVTAVDTRGRKLVVTAFPPGEMPRPETISV